MTRIAVALSGGVDSSTAFMMLREQGHEVFGVTMRHLPREMASERVGSCCAPSAIAGAARLADSVGAASYVFNMENEFAAAVMAPSAKAYASGTTPNPCVWCNENIKFDALYRRAMALGAELFATGHYARIIGGILHRAVDQARDQSYFLYRVRPDVLEKTIFPLGEFTKPEIRDKARAFGIEMHDKEDSMDICFAPQGDFTAAFERHAPEAMEAGEIVDEAGIVRGRHAGVGRVTLGQRRGLGVASAERMYVTRIEPDTRRVVIGDRPVADELTLGSVVLNADVPDHFTAMARIRSQHRGICAAVTRTGPTQVRVVLDSPQSGVTPGQSVVFFEGDKVLGGGVIVNETHNPR